MSGSQAQTTSLGRKQHAPSQREYAPVRHALERDSYRSLAASVLSSVVEDLGDFPRPPELRQGDNPGCDEGSAVDGLPRGPARIKVRSHIVATVPFPLSHAALLEGTRPPVLCLGPVPGNGPQGAAGARLALD